MNPFRGHEDLEITLMDTLTRDWNSSGERRGIMSRARQDTQAAGTSIQGVLPRRDDEVAPGVLPGCKFSTRDRILEMPHRRERRSRVATDLRYFPWRNYRLLSESSCVHNAG